VDQVPASPDVTVLSRPPRQDDVLRWITTWKPVWFHYHGVWRLGIVKAQVQARHGGWALQIEHGSDGMRPGWPASLWVVHDPKVVVPVKAPTPSARPPAQI
jgi:hypothetical protein